VKEIEEKFSVAAAAEYKYVKTADEYRKVLDLRKLAYSGVGKVDKDANPEVMGDIYDTKSRILMASINGRVVGSHRITFHGPGEKNEYEEFVTLPPNFPDRNEVLVLSRICTDPEFRGSGLFYGLFRRCISAAIEYKRRYILGGCTANLLPLYKKIGFKEQGIFFEHGNLQGAKEQIILADALEITAKEIIL
jgi:predicted GNAT family N-acyltransferase